MRGAQGDFENELAFISWVLQCLWLRQQQWQQTNSDSPTKGCLRNLKILPLWAVRRVFKEPPPSWRGRRGTSLVAQWLRVHLAVQEIQIQSLVELKKETELPPSWKQDAILGWTVDFELYAPYLWKQHTNWKTRPPGWKSPRAHT